MKTSRFVFPPKIACAALAALIGGTVFTSHAEVDAVTNPPGMSAAQPHVISSPGIRDIVKMIDAKVDVEVIKAYIKSSSIAFAPTASDIIELKRRGVPDELITALLQRGAEVRGQLAQAAAGQPNVPQSAPTAPPQGYGYNYSAAQPYLYSDYSDYGYGYPYSSYPVYPYGYGYPYYAFGYPYYWGYGYPWVSYWPFYRFGHRFGDFDRFHHFDRFRDFDRFHGGRSFAFQGRGGFAGRGGWAPAGGFANRSFAGHAGFSGRGFAMGGARTGGFAGHSGGGGFGGHGGSFGGHSGGGGGHR